MLNKPEKAPEKAVVARKATTPEGVKTKPAVSGATIARVARVREAAGEDRYQMIAELAYFRAEQRGFTPGRELDDWLAAEIEVDEMLGAAEPRV